MSWHDLQTDTKTDIGGLINTKTAMDNYRMKANVTGKGLKTEHYKNQENITDKQAKTKFI